MGLLDGLLGELAGGALGGGGAQARSPFGAGGGGQAELLRIVLSMLAGGGARAPQGGGGLDGVLGQVLGSALGGGGRAAPAGMGGGGLGGLGDLMARFQQAGMGDTMNSWIGTGENAPIEPGQLSSVLGADTLGQIASQLGMSQGDVAGQLSQLLPEVVDRLTPQGRVPEGGLGGVEDLLGALMRR
jgi:uncharacterized protein YidB (DUF937 family)